ncbi:MAG TPA: hypothetical protein VLL05_08755, partial [Terriglobales bacterium]|nr:hypothetical protein [Terriglobales bacterium]
LYRRNDFGFTIGGPLFIPGVYNLRKEKTFVFWSEEFRYEKSPTDQQPNFNHAVPSLAERLGDFNDVCPQNASTFSRSLFPDCPSAGPSSSAGLLQTFPQNIVSAVPDVNGALDPNALAFLNTNLIPLPNSATGCNSTIDSCYNAVISEPTYWREELFRLDHNLTSKLHLSLRYIHDAWHTTVPVPQWGFIKNSFPTVQNKFVGPGISVVAKLTDTITPSLLNDFTATYANSDITLENVNGPGGADVSRPPQLSQPGGTCQDLINNVGGNTLILPSCPMGTLFNNGFGGKAPGLLIGGTNQAYGGSGFAVDPAYMPWSHTNPTYSVRDDVSIAIGKHTLQFGAQYILSQRNELNGAIGAASGDIQGLLTFSNINGGDGNTGNAFANFLTLLNRGSGASFGINAIQSFTQDSTQQRYHNSYHIVEPYVQDDWRVNSRLTVNLGLRFSIFSLFQEKDKRAYNWDPKAYDPAVATQLVVDPNTGQLLSATQGGPIPLNPNSPDPRLLNGIVQCGVNGVPRGCMKGHLFNPAPRIGFALDPRGNGKTSIRAGYGIFFEHGTPEEANTGSLEGSAPLVLSVTQRFPANYGCIGGTQPTCMVSPGAYPLDVTAIPTKAIWPYAQQWSLSVQQELPASMVATVAYVGSKGTHLTVERQLNQLRPLPEGANPFGVHQPLIPQAIVGNGGDCGGFVAPQPGVAPGFFLLNGTVVGPESPAYVSLIAACAGANSLPETPTPDVNTLRRYPGFGQIFSLQNVADSSYHALQATVRRSRGPLTVGVSYSYSHSFDDASDRSDTTLVDSFDLHSNRASSNFDQRHLLSVSYIYSLPGKKLIDAWQRWINSDGSADSSVPPPPASRLTQALLDGWQISGITTFTSGTPFSVTNGGSSTISVLDNAGVANGIGAGSYPDRAPGPTGGKPQGGNNPKSFGPLLGDPNRFVAPRGLTFGNAGRNYLNNPGRLNFDMSLLKHFSITESSVLELRAEAFNIFNHTQFRIYNPDLGNTGSNVISCYGGSDYRAGYSVPGGVDCLTGSSFLHPVDAHRPRTVQLGLKYTF